MSKKKKPKQKIDEFILAVRKQSLNKNFSKEIIIKDNFFIAHVAKGSEKYRMAMLEKLLNTGKVDEGAKFYDYKYEEEVKIRFQNPSYLAVVKYNRYKMFKYFGIESIEELANYFKIDISKLKIQYEEYIRHLKSVPLEIHALRKFINDQKNQIKFLQETNLPLNISNFCNILEVVKEEETRLLGELNQLLATERAEVERERELAAIKRAEEAQIQYEKKLRDHSDYLISLKGRKDLPLYKIYPLLDYRLTLAVLNKSSLTLEELTTYLELPIKKQDYTARKKELLTKYCRGKEDCIHNMNIAEALSITPTELKRWKDEGRLVPTESRSFNKWGKVLYSDYFAVDYLCLITAEDINQWRMEGQLKKIPNSEKPTSDIIKLVQEAEKKGFLYRNNKWYTLLNLNIDNYIIKQLIQLSIPKEITEYKTATTLIKNLNSQKELISVSKEENKLIKKIEKYQLTNEIKDKMLVHLSEHTNKLLLKDFQSNTVTKTMESQIAVFLQIQQQQKIIDQLKIEKYEIGYPLARNLDRDIKIIVGPTNSGKTYEALQHLSQATSGVYLAPLRLLAMEIYDKLNSAGVPCNLITGEEKIIVPGARHTSSTIEMMNQSEAVEVAIIDEFQMLDDLQRGWAWTTAMVGVPAKTVYVIGNEQKLEVAINLYKHLEEKYEVIKKKRFSELKPIPKLIPLNKLEKGDALIAFSRKDILSYATALREKGYKVSIIYGALSPEVRRRQAQMFTNGETDIVVSTDAIGMGLNLPIKRIIFATINKFDGTMVRQLRDSELLQIAGRAGRYGLNEEGFVGLLDNKVNTTYKLEVLSCTLNSGVNSSPKKLVVAPTNWHINIISTILKTKELNKILLYFTSLKYNSIYQTANLEQQILLYAQIKSVLKTLPLQEQYHLLTAPVELNNQNLVDYYEALIKGLVANHTYEFSTQHYYDLESAELENKKLTIYAWLSFYYTNFKTTNISSERDKLSNFIEKRLLKERNYNFSQMIQPRTRAFEDYY